MIGASAESVFGPVVIAATVTALGGVLMAWINRRRPKQSMAEVIDSRTRWLVGELRTQIDTANREVATLKGEVAAAQAAADSCHDERLELQRRIADLESEALDCRSQITKMALEIEGLKGKG